MNIYNLKKIAYLVLLFLLFQNISFADLTVSTKKLNFTEHGAFYGIKENGKKIRGIYKGPQGEKGQSDWYGLFTEDQMYWKGYYKHTFTNGDILYQYNEYKIDDNGKLFQDENGSFQLVDSYLISKDEFEVVKKYINYDISIPFSFYDFKEYNTKKNKFSVKYLENLDIPKFDIKVTSDESLPNIKKVANFRSQELLRHHDQRYKSDINVQYLRKKSESNLILNNTRFVMINDHGIVSDVRLSQVDKYPQFYSVRYSVINNIIQHKQNYIYSDGNFYKANLSYRGINDIEYVSLNLIDQDNKEVNVIFAFGPNSRLWDEINHIQNIAFQTNFFKKDLDIKKLIKEFSKKKDIPIVEFQAFKKIDSKFSYQGDCVNNIKPAESSNKKTWSCEKLLEDIVYHNNEKSVDKIKMFFDSTYEDYLTALNINKIHKTDEKYYALVIGNNNYKYIEKLDAAVNDAKVVSDLLEKKYGFETELLLDANYDETVNSLYKITKKLKKNDNLLIYYAGHGELDKSENRGYWLPVDASYEMRSKWVSNQIIVDRIKATKAKHVLLIADSCFSGTLMRSSDMLKEQQSIDQKYIERLKNKKTRLVITSGGNEPVVDSDGGNHSLFALKLIDTLKNNNEVINSQILFENIRRYVVANADQTPERAMVHKTGHDGGDFLFFPVN